MEGGLYFWYFHIFYFYFYLRIDKLSNCWFTKLYVRIGWNCIIVCIL